MNYFWIIYPRHCISSFRVTLGKEEFISLVKPLVVFKFYGKKENNLQYLLSCSIAVWKIYLNLGLLAF